MLNRPFIHLFSQELSNIDCLPEALLGPRNIAKDTLLHSGGKDRQTDKPELREHHASFRRQGPGTALLS